MAKPDKILEKALAGSKNIRCGDFEKLLQAFGFEHRRTSGSHSIYKHPEVSHLLSIQPSKNGQAKPYQIRQFLKLVEEYNLSIDR